MNDLLKFFFIGFLITVFSVALFLVMISTAKPANGQHTGYITAEEKSGYIWETDKFFFKTDTMSSQEDIYCVRNETLYAEASRYVDSKTHVTIFYSNGLWLPPWQCNGGDTIVYRIEEVRP